MKRKLATEAFIQNDSHEPQPLSTPIVVLREFFDLLEEYAPIWYTEELHNRAVAALSTGTQQRRTG